MKMVDDCVDNLCCRKKLSNSPIKGFPALKVQDLQNMAIKVSVQITGSGQKKDSCSKDINWCG